MPNSLSPRKMNEKKLVSTGIPLLKTPLLVTPRILMLCVNNTKAKIDPKIAKNNIGLIPSQTIPVEAESSNSNIIKSGRNPIRPKRLCQLTMVKALYLCDKFLSTAV